MAHLGDPGGFTTDGAPTLGPRLMEYADLLRLIESPDDAPQRHHVYLLDLGNVEQHLKMLIAEVQGLRSDLESRTLSARLRRLWSTIRAWLRRTN